MTAQRFRELHRGGELLVLPNAWDAGSAAVVQHAGAAAVATTSAGVAWSFGYPDGNQLPSDALLDAVRRIVRVLHIPLTVDIEEGGSDDPATVAAGVVALVDAGVAGVNIEDGVGSPDVLVGKIAAIRKALGDRDLYINARTDVYLRGMASGDAAVDEVLRRAGRYVEAGADGMFVPGIAVVEEIRTVAKALGSAPLNVMLVPGLPDRAALYGAGARRLSAGIAIALEALSTANRMAADFLGKPVPADLNYGSLNALLSRG